MARRKVMISSTARDLPKHREEIRLGCERAGFEPRVMEHLPALDADAIKASLQLVEEADVYVGVFAYRYGYVPEGHDISITEMEYDRAVQLNKPRLIFFIDEDHPITKKDVESGPSELKLKILKDRLGKERVVTFFNSPKDLRSQVVEALSALGRELDEATNGADAVAITAAKLHRKTSIPTPPEIYVAHPYTLLQSRDLVGRQAELNALTDWVTKPAFDAPILCFVAIGGMGKSALTWKWFNQIAPNEMKPLAGRMWWSFYESDATFENFLNRALCYVSGQIEDEVRLLPRPEREAQLLQQLNEKPYLFALDGLERVLIAYNRMDASNLADDDYDRQTANVVAGAAGLPATAAQSFVGQHRLRQTTDPRAGSFLRKLAQVTKSRILITTRLYPSELQLQTGFPCPGSSAYFLRGLADDDALALWRALQVSGSRQELVPIFYSVENHPLLIQALASEVANYKKAPGDFTKWQVDHPQFDPTALPLVQSRTQILDYALRGLRKLTRKVLHTLVGFRMPASYASLEALLVGPRKACKSAQELDRALTELEDRGLIGWDREANRYDAHPIVRGVVWQFTDAKDQRAVYAALEAHFEPMAVPDADDVKALAELSPAIERYHTLIELGRYDDAFELFRDRLDRATFFRLAAHRERIAWIERLFPDGEASLPRLSNSNSSSFVLHILALSYQFSGQAGKAVSLYRRANEIDKQANDKPNYQVGLLVLSDSLLQVGALRDATAAGCSSLILIRNQKDRPNEGSTVRSLGALFNTIGKHALGYCALARSRKLFAAEKRVQSEGVSCAFLVERFLWLGEFTNAKTLADKAWHLAQHLKLERDVIHAALLQGRVHLGLGNLLRAEEQLHYALTKARAVNIVEEIPTLIAIAELDLQRGRSTEARARLDDIWEAAGRGPYPAYLADANNVLADIAFAEGDEPAAIDAATKAYRAAWCDGPPYAYHWGLEKAKAHLAALGAPEPDMPPFDESKFEPLPDIEINPKDKYWVDPDKLD